MLKARCQNTCLWEAVQKLKVERRKEKQSKKKTQHTIQLQIYSVNKDVYKQCISEDSAVSLSAMMAAADVKYVEYLKLFWE